MFWSLDANTALLTQLKTALGAAYAGFILEDGSRVPSISQPELGDIQRNRNLVLIIAVRGYCGRLSDVKRLRHFASHTLSPTSSPQRRESYGADV